jgi:hypothetical protein
LGSLPVQAGRFAFKRNQRVESLVPPERTAAQTWPPFSREVTPAAKSQTAQAQIKHRESSFLLGVKPLLYLYAQFREKRAQKFFGNLSNARAEISGS